MRRMPTMSMLVGVLFSFAFFGTETRTFAQNENVQKVRIETSDGVELQGYWYPSAKRNAQTVLLLHALGQDCTKREWKNLATALQKEGYAVLGFDFRGHGGSTNLSDPQTFWRLNGNLLKGGKNLNTIEYKNFNLHYLPYLANDIAAAKAYLDMKNDGQECNSSALVLIGAETGATLGAIWMNSEWYRVRLIPPQPPLSLLTQADVKNPAGANVMAAFFLSISPDLGGNRKNFIGKVLRAPMVVHDTPTVFFYNADDKKDKDLAVSLANMTKNLKGQGARFKYTGSSNVPNAKDLKGRELLQEGLPTQKRIIDHLDLLVKDAKFNDWAQQDLKTYQYIWYLGPDRRFQWVPANSLGSKTFNFCNYYKFIPN